jgi:thiamine-phosphate pyrophosphorylase
MALAQTSAKIARFYPIVPDVGWLERIAPLGVETVQLRIKDQQETDVRRQVRLALEIARKHGCQLIVNDFWKVAIEEGADFIHLGQDDLKGADIAAVRRAGIRIGVSTHDAGELDAALAIRPDYVALGPIYETKLKVMPWAPQGLARVTEWKQKIGGLQLIGIGGITPERAGDVLAAGADSVAVITDFMTAADPEARVRRWVALAAGH